MANGGENRSPDLHNVYVDSNFDTGLVVLVHSEDTVSHFKENFCQEHKKNFPEIGDIQISAMKVEQGNRFYHFSDSMIWSKLFEGIPKWFICVDVVKVERGKETAALRENLSLEEDLQREPKQSLQAAVNEIGDNVGSREATDKIQSVKNNDQVADLVCGEEQAVQANAPLVSTSQPSTQQFSPIVQPFDASTLKAFTSMDTDSNPEQSFGAPFQPTQPAFTSQVSHPDNFVSEDSFPAVQNVQPQEQFTSSQSGLDTLVPSITTSHFHPQPVPIAGNEMNDKVFEEASKEVAEDGTSLQESKKIDRIGKSTDENRTPEHEVAKYNVTVDADEAKPVKSTKKKKSKKAKTTFEVEEAPCKDLASKVEDSAAEEKHFQNVDQYASGVDKVEVKIKKRKRTSEKKKKSCHVKKDDVSVPRIEEEPENDGEKLDTCLSSSILLHDNVVHKVASPETGDTSRCFSEGQGTRKLLVFDFNGILADVVHRYNGQSVPDGTIFNNSVFIRPFVAGFLDFCFERFDVGIWSSRRIGLKNMTDLVLGNHAKDLLFCFGQHMCTNTDFNTLEKPGKPLFLKNLRSVWNHCEKGKYDETNTLLVDDSPAKALCNPPHTAIFPYPYKYTDQEDSALGPNGELRKYLERLVDAENVQKFVAENPIGQTAITETHESWEFYSKVVEKYK